MRQSPSAAATWHVTRTEIEGQTRKLYEEAHQIDSLRVDEATRVVTGHDAFAWGSLSVEQLSGLRRVLLAIRMG